MSCVNAEEALAALGSAGPYDLLLTDIALGPGMRGTELASRAQQQQPALRVLLMSGFASGLLAAPPGWELLRKPYTREDLSRSIAKVLGAR
jgi:CheY-like chemotaxis protein